MAARRTLMIGLDGMVPNVVERFFAEGAMPNLARLAERGCFTRIRPVIPAQTPTNWTTLATGATPGGHGIVQWGSHLPGELVSEYHREEAFNSGLCRAEYIWEAAARAGARSVVMNYAGYPPTTDSAVFIDWLFSPSRSYFDLAGATVYHNCPELATTDPLELAPATCWGRLPSPNALEAEVEIVPSEAGEGPRLHLLVWGMGDSYDRITLCREKRLDTVIAELFVGQWSDWLKGEFVLEGQQVEGAFRFKLLELASDGSRIRLFRTDAFPKPGALCSDVKVGRLLDTGVGPYVHSASSCHLERHFGLDWATLDELMAQEATWWARAARLAMDETDARLLVLHWHPLDFAGHALTGAIDPTAHDWDEANLESNWALLRGYYQAADRLVGEFLAQFDLEEDVFAVVSDHGSPGNKAAVSLVNAFLPKGWVTATPDGKSLDWAASQVFFVQNHLWINLQGRDEGGLVPMEEYEGLRKTLLEELKSLRDPDTGEHVFAFVLLREDAPMVGLWGDYLGDIVFCYSGGYRWSGPEVLAMGESRVVFPSGGGNHGPMIPTYETETTSVLGALVLAGPGVKATRVPKLDQARFCTTDVAPTLAALAGLPAPAQSEGRPLVELLESAVPLPERRLTPTTRAIRHRPSTRPRPPQLQGDVTDEV